MRRLAASPASAAEAVDALLRDVRAFAGRAPQHDDITIVAVRCQEQRAGVIGEGSAFPTPDH
jgi:serine phosphatase RsbU (regulator of sigma subunit)